VFGDLGEMVTDERNFQVSLEKCMPRHNVCLDMSRRVFVAERHDLGKLLENASGTFGFRQECLTPWERKDLERHS